MMRRPDLCALAAVLCLSGCAQIGPGLLDAGAGPQAESARAAAFEPPAELPAEPNEAPSAVSARYLGHTVAELGPADRAGLWLRTSAVETEVPGWATDLETGRSTRLLLLPGEAGQRDAISVEALGRLGVSSPQYLILRLHRDVRGLPG